LRIPVSIVADLIAENPDVLGSLLLDVHLRLSALHSRMATIEPGTARRSRGLGIDRLSSEVASPCIGSAIRTEATVLNSR
jgi:hypothetical protein